MALDRTDYKQVVDTTLEIAIRVEDDEFCEEECSLRFTVLLQLLIKRHTRLVHGIATGYTDVWEHSGGDWHIDVGKSPIIEDHYSPKLGNPLGCRGSTCVEVMITLHGNTILFGGMQMVAYRRRSQSGSVPWVEWERGSINQFELEDGYSAEMLAAQTLHTISRDQATVIPPIVTPVTIIEDPRSHMDKLERRIKQMRDPDEIISWDDPDDVPVATLPISFRMPDIERYMGVGCPRIHLRLYSIVMRALGLDEA
ncbi:hypothetical protein CK203_000973 [Vitis vinifera]|uniref:Uncharacterized protein n=1 Tax=Vitis vinifera TaxID=29760 RepID=A0A438KKL0_VITVI|nr:hypothetical protein CK203_000973 [Vitis vinifera]